MGVRDKEKLKSNKSSIVRVIISNFDDKQIKEIKVLYNKQGGVDVIRLNGTEPDKNGKMKFNFKSASNRLEDEETYNLGENDGQTFFVTTNDDSTELCVTKKNKFTNEIIKKYRLFGEYVTTNSKEKKVIVSISDDIDYSDEKYQNSQRKNKRTVNQSTNRILLDLDVINNYRQIACSESEKIDENVIIDSKEIYKINKFLNYRSDMIIYYQIINNFIMQGSTKKDVFKNEIWRFVQSTETEAKEELLKECSNYLYNHYSKFIERYNQFLNGDKNGIKGKEINIDTEMIKNDLEKIFLILSEFRHSLVHYNYAFYKELYSGKDFIFYDKNNKEVKFSELLDLNIFKELGKIKLIKDRAVTNYLDKNSVIYVLGSNFKAIKLLDKYRDICEGKNGFNNFINSMLTVSGEENIEFKKVINEHFNQGIENLSNYIEKLKIEDSKNNKGKQRIVRLLEKKLDEQKRLNDWFDAAYVYDIHTSKQYKDLYNKRKDLVSRYSQIIEKGIDVYNKKDLTDINQELSKLNTDMKEMTKLNAKYRLQYKMQLAFGFINEEFNLDIHEFKNAFNKDKETLIAGYMAKRDKYIYSTCSKSEYGKEFPLLKLERTEAEDIFSSNRNNNLVKFYILLYLLLPDEIRGDFLGFAKKNYYDMKHVDFIEIENEENKDNFFHDLRLFERNAKKLEILNYDLISGLMDESYGKEFANKVAGFVRNKFDLPEDMDIGEYNKALILPMMKYYQIIFKLLNDIEIYALFRYSEKFKGTNSEDNNFKKAIDKVSGEGFLNFTQLMKKSINVGGKGGKYQIRNNIAHINIKELYMDPLNDYSNNKQENMSISEQIEKTISTCESKNLIGKEFKSYKCNYLYRNILNDYYMGKEQLVYALKLRKEENLVRIDDYDKNKDNVTVLRKYGLYDKNEKANLGKTIKRFKALDAEIEKIDVTAEKELKRRRELAKDRSLLHGIIRKNINFMLREIALDIIQKGEYKYINVYVYYKNDDLTKLSSLKYQCRINKGKREYILVKSKVDGDLEVIQGADNSNEIKIICNKDKDPNKKISTIDLKYKYIQNVRLVVK